MCLCSEEEIVIHSTEGLPEFIKLATVMLLGILVVLWCSKSGLQFLEVETFVVTFGLSRAMLQ